MNAYIAQWLTPTGYLIHALMPQAICHELKIGDSASALVRSLPSAVRLLVFHVNLSWSRRFLLERRRAIAELSQRGTQVWNLNCDDIRKRTLHRRLRAAGLPSARANQRGDGDELVIVKTNENYGAESERAISQSARRQLGIAEPSAQILDALDYRVMPRRDVPPAWWSDRQLAMERYVTNERNVVFRVYLCGERVVVTKAFNTALIKKMTAGIQRLNYLCDTRSSSWPDSVPREMRHLVLSARAAMRLDFGTIDVVQDNRGACYVVDVNTTPYWGAESQSDIIEHLRGAIGAVLESQSLARPLTVTTPSF